MADSKENETRFEEMYKAYFPKLVRFAQSFLLSKEAAENLVQDAFLKLYERRDVIPYGQNLGGFLFTVVKNRCIDTFRRSRGKRVTIVETGELDAKLHALEKFDNIRISDAELEMRIKEAVDALPERCRQVFTLCRLEGKSNAETAELMGISLNTVERQMGIALHKLRDALEGYLPVFIFFI